MKFIKSEREIHKNENKTLVDLLNRGVNFIKENKPNDAYSCFQAALRLDPNHLETLVSMGTCLMKMENHEGAYEYFSKAVKIDSNNCNALYSLGFLYYTTEKYEEAVKLFNSVIDLELSFVPAWHYKIKSLEKLGRNNDAMECSKKLAKLTSKIKI